MWKKKRIIFENSNNRWWKTDCLQQRSEKRPWVKRKCATVYNSQSWSLSEEGGGVYLLGLKMSCVLRVLFAKSERVEFSQVLFPVAPHKGRNQWKAPGIDQSNERLYSIQIKPDTTFLCGRGRNCYSLAEMYCTHLTMYLQITSYFDHYRRTLILRKPVKKALRPVDHSDRTMKPS